MKLIVISGGMGVGKTTAIEYLKDTHLHLKVELIKFAQPIYDAQEFLYRRISNVYNRPPNFVKDRRLLQWLGTQWGREISPNLWVDLWQEEVRYAMENYPDKVLVCDDCRFDNEAEVVRKMGGTIVKVTSERSHERIPTDGETLSHASEAGINDKYVDFLIKNDYSKEEFYNALDSLFKEIL